MMRRLMGGLALAFAGLVGKVRGAQEVIAARATGPAPAAPGTGGKAPKAAKTRRPSHKSARYVAQDKRAAVKATHKKQNRAARRRIAAA